MVGSSGGGLVWEWLVGGGGGGRFERPDGREDVWTLAHLWPRTREGHHNAREKGRAGHTGGRAKGKKNRGERALPH